ncbi:MAG: hypothetical protein AAFU41_06970 [Pseudomonadota bacterium]
MEIFAILSLVLIFLFVLIDGLLRWIRHLGYPRFAIFLYAYYALALCIGAFALVTECAFGSRPGLCEDDETLLPLLGVVVMPAVAVLLALRGRAEWLRHYRSGVG